MTNNINMNFSSDSSINIFNKKENAFMTHNILIISTTHYLSSSILSEDPIDLKQKQQSDSEFNHDTDKNNKSTEYIIQNVEYNNDGEIIRQYFLCENSSDHHFKKKANTTYQREKESKKSDLSKAHEYLERFFEDEYDALQALLETIINIVNQKNILEIWQHFLSIFKMSSNAKFDIKLVFKCWYTDPMQTSNSLLIIGTIREQSMITETNQVMSIREADIFQSSIHANITQKQEYVHSFGVAKSRLKFAIENSLVDEFIELITRFIENHTGINANQWIL
ncbi:7100_t:CDS:2, partial [Racocetra persica]